LAKLGIKTERVVDTLVLARCKLAGGHDTRSTSCVRAIENLQRFDTLL